MLSREGRLGRRLTAATLPAAAVLESSVPLDAEGDAHAAADAERGEALLGVALLHLVEQGGQDAGAAGADRVADGDGAAVDVDLVGVPAELLADRERLGGEGLVGLDQVEVGDRPAGLLERASSTPGPGRCP